MTDYTLETLLAEEQGLQIPHFDYDFIWELGSRMHATAAKRRLPVAIEITHGHDPVFFSLLPGATPDNHEWVRRKRNVVLRFHHSSLYWRLHCEKAGVQFNTRYRVPDGDFAASGGGVPLLVAGAGLVGVAAVSGLPDVEDHRLVVTTLVELFGAPAGPDAQAGPASG